MIKKSSYTTEQRIHIVTSGYCNNNCIFCCDRDPYITTKIRNLSFYGSTNLTLDGFMREGKKQKNIDSILFTGGEPTLNHKLIKCIKTASNLGYDHIGLQTNGRLLSYKDYCIKLLQSGLTEVNISIHGSNKKIHEGLTRTRGGFTQSLKGLRNLIALKKLHSFRLNTNSTITKLNYKDINDLLKMFLSFVDIDNIVLNILMYTGNAKRFFSHSFVSYLDIVREFKEAIDNLGRENNFRGSAIKLSPIPFCVMKGYTKYVGIQEKPLCIIKTKIRKLSRGSFQVKGKKCSSCTYYSVCSGIDRVYAKRIGWSEFSPIR